MGVRDLKIEKCKCGKEVTKESVFCLACKTIIERKNLKVIDREKATFNKKYFN